MTTCFPLAEFERYMLLDDQDTFSMTCHIRFWFDGRLDRNHFEAALIKAIGRHPIFSSYIETRRIFGIWPRPAFVTGPIKLDEILEWKESFEPSPVSRITRRDMRVRFIVCTSEDQSLLVVKFHHASTDGMGVFQFAEDLMLAYDAAFSKNASPSFKPLNPVLLYRRVDFGMTWLDWLKRLHLDLARFGRFFNKFPASLAPVIPKVERPKQSDAGAAVRVVTPIENVATAQALSKSLAVTFNDLMISRLLKACLNWNRAQGAKIRPWMPFRINVPISLRTAEEEAMPAANYVSMVFLDRMPGVIDNESLVVRSVADEMGQVKRDRMGLTLIMAVSIMMKLKIFGPILRSGFCMTTVGLTNLGQPFRDFVLTQKDGRVKTGNVTLLGLDTFPPVRRNTLATLSVNRYAGLLSMTVRYDSTSWRAKDAEDFLNLYMQSLLNQQTTLTPAFGLIVRTPC